MKITIEICQTVQDFIGLECDRFIEKSESKILDENWNWSQEQTDAVEEFCNELRNKLERKKVELEEKYKKDAVEKEDEGDNK